MLRWGDLLFEGALQLVQRQDIRHIFFNVDDTIGNETNRLLELFPGARNTAGQMDFIQDGAIQLERDCR